MGIKSSDIVSILPFWIVLVTAGPLAAQSAFREPPLAMATQIVLESHVSGAPHKWLDEKSGETGSVTPVRTFKTKAGVFCRDYEVSIENGSTNLHRACRAQGLWIEIKAPQG